MKLNELGKGLIKIISAVTIIAALALSGAVPCFDITAFAEEINLPEEHIVVSAAEIDYSRCPAPDATSVILMDAKSGEVLYEKNPDQSRDPASITKILNCLVVMDTLDFNREVTVEIEPETEGSIMKLQKGETLTVRDLVYGMMLVSGNDAAEYLAYLAGEGDINAFCEMMNEKARSMGADNTVYTNPNGLNPPGKQNNITTARDIAAITTEAMKIPQFREIVGTAKYTIPATNKFKARKLKNSNRCLWDTKMKVEIDGAKRPVKYDKCIGVKTGYSGTAGDCIAGYVKEGNTELVSVVLNSPHEENKFRDSINLWNYGLKGFETFTVEKSENVLVKNKVSGGTLREVDLGLAEDMCITVNRGYDSENNITTEVELNQKRAEAPVRRGDVLGRLVAYNEKGAVVALQDLVSMENADTGGPLSRIGVADEDIFLFITAVTAILLLIIAAIVFITRRKRK